MQFSYRVIALFTVAALCEGHKLSGPVKSSCDDTPRTNIGRLKKALFCGYDSSTRPVVDHSNPTPVSLAAFPTHLGYVGEETNFIWLSFWISMHWTDELLTWNTSEYDGVKSFEVSGSKIWTPDITVTFPMQTMHRQLTCKVFSTGNVDCFMLTSLYVQCEMDLQDFPSDQHPCRVVFGARVYKGSELNVDFINSKDYDPYMFYHPHGVWKLESFKEYKNKTALFNDDYIVNLGYTFKIRRVNSHTVMYSTPAFVIMLTVLSVFWLEAQSSARITLPALCILIQMVMVEVLVTAIPANFGQLPKIIKFFRDSLLITGLALVWSVASRVMSSSSSSPHWLYVVSTSLSNKPYFKFILPDDIFMKSGSTGDEDESSLMVRRDCVEQQWRVLTVLADRLLFLFFTTIYILLYIMLIP